MWTETHRAAAKRAIAGDIAVHDAAVLPTIRKYIEAGLSMRKTAEKLNKMGYPSPGNRSRATRYKNNWSAASVQRICRRHGISRRGGTRVYGREGPSRSPNCRRLDTHSIRPHDPPTRSHLSLLTPERWERARYVLHGEYAHAISVEAAARAAGVTLTTFRAWLRRALERSPGDNALLTRVADDYESRYEMQGDVLKDLLWSRAINGQTRSVYYRGKKVGEETVYDTDLMLRFLEARDPRCRGGPRSRETGQMSAEGKQRLWDNKAFAATTEAIIEDRRTSAPAPTPPAAASQVIRSGPFEIECDFPTDL